MQLIENAKSAHKLLSVQIPAVGLAVLGAWSALPPDIQESFPHGMAKYIGIAVMVCSIIGRLVKQGDPA